MKKISFEEYRKNQEKLFPITNDSALEHIRRNYESEMDSIDDSEHLNIISNTNAKNLNFDDFELDEIRIFGLSSFTPSFELSITNRKLSIKSKGSNPLDIALDPETIEELNLNSFSSETKRLIRSSKKPKRLDSGLDGTMYFFTYKDQLGIQQASKHIYNEDSPVGHYIRHLETIMEKIEKHR